MSPIALVQAVVTRFGTRIHHLNLTNNWLVNMDTTVWCI